MSPIRWKLTTITILLIIILQVIVTNIGAGAYTVNPGVRLGGPKIQLQQAANGPDYKLEIEQLRSKLDKNHNNIADDLEAKANNLPPNQSIGVIVLFDAHPTINGGDAKIIVVHLKEIMKDLEEEGANITAGPWRHVLVGFAMKIPAGILYNISRFIPTIDIDGDGVKDSFIMLEDKPVHAFNHWSSKQMNIRPYVYSDLGVKGDGVTVVVIDTGIDGNNSAFPDGKIVYWADYVGDSSGTTHSTPYDDNLHGTHVAGTVAGYYDSMDSQGRLVLNFGISDVDWSSAPTNEWLKFYYPIVAYYVNATGTLELNFKWKPDTTSTRTQGAVSKVGLAFCGDIPYPFCSVTDSNVVVSIDTPNSDTWYNITYNITSSSQFGFYTLVFQLSQGGGLALLPILRVPVDPDSSTGAPYLSGMAPNANLGGAKVLSYYGSGYTSDIASAIDDVVGNATIINPPPYVISMSLGGGYSSTLDTSVTNAFNSGILVVVAAGNEGPSGDAATGSPANNPYAITVAAIDGLGNITDYSSSGGASNSSSIAQGDTVIKPDLAAPGGGTVVQIFSADTTWHDDLSNAYYFFLFGYMENIDWQDTINLNTEGFDDSIGIQGTSMATPHISGAAALVISALVNNASYTWTWDSSSPRFVKNILLASTYETYPLLREENASYSPTLDKGGKDEHEGYGALDAGAAVDIALSMAEGKAILPGSVVTTSFRDGSAYNANFTNGQWHWIFGRSVWGSRVYLPIASFTLSNGSSYTVTYVFHLRSDTSDSQNTDFDLYLYNLTGNKYGEPVILASSTGGMGVQDELFQYTPSAEESVILVAKRAREDSAGGNAYIVIGPFIDAYSNANGNIDNQYAYTGYSVEITGLSAYNAPTAKITVFDNTTGQVLDTLTVTTTSSSAGYSQFDTTWTVPNDSSLDGHQLLFIVKYLDSNGNTVEGPTYDSLTVSSSPPPVPEPGIVPVIVVSALVALLLWRLSRL